MMSKESVNDMQREFADVDINNGDLINEDYEQDEEEEVPSPAVANNNGLNQNVIHVSSQSSNKLIKFYCKSNKMKSPIN